MDPRVVGWILPLYAEYFRVDRLPRGPAMPQRGTRTFDTAKFFFPSTTCRLYNSIDIERSCRVQFQGER